jgi:outer membrane protein
MRAMKTIVIMIIVMLPWAAFAQETRLSVDEAIALALRENRTILITEQDVAKARQALKESQAGMFPSLTASGTWSHTKGLYADKDSQLIAGALAVRQPLYQGGRIISTIRFSEASVEVARAVLDAEKLTLVALVRKAYYSAVLAKALVALDRAIKDNTEQHRALIYEKYKNGHLPETEILQIDAALSSVNQEYEASTYQEEIALNTLKNIIALDPGMQVSVDAELYCDPKDVAFEEAFLQAFARRPEIRQYDAQVAAAQSSVGIARAGSRPSVEASWDYYMRSRSGIATSGFSAGPKNWNDYQVVGLSVSWPIFDGWGSRAKVEKALVDVRQAQLMKSRGAQDISYDVKNSYLALREAIARLGAADDDIKVYKVHYDTMIEQQGKGIASGLDVSDAALKYEVSLFNHKQAVYDYLVSYSDFERATGG